MADIQAQFGQFHDKIKLKEENEELREKRDTIVSLLRNKLDEFFKNRGEPTPAFEVFNQGSYAMHTGTVPINSDYDIDIGLRFSLSKDDYPDPIQVKEWIRDALQGHTKKDPEIKEPCVRVIYSIGDEPDFHVDLAIYSDSEANTDNKTYLARGKLDSDSANKIWEEAEPQNLLDLVNNYFPDENQEEERKQFRRSIRYMKRWKDLNFLHTGHSSPVGIGLTLAAIRFFNPFVTIDTFTNTTKIDDLSALTHWIGMMISSFQVVKVEDGNSVERLIMPLPVAPYTDVFSKMTDEQMAEFKEKLQHLKDELELAASEPDPHEACERLNKDDIFGEDFPVPPKEETGEPRSKAYTSSGQSGYAI